MVDVLPGRWEEENDDEEDDEVLSGSSIHANEDCASVERVGIGG